MPNPAPSAVQMMDVTTIIDTFARVSMSNTVRKNNARRKNSRKKSIAPTSKFGV